MAEKFKALERNHIEFIKQQQIFFVGTAGPEGTVNVSPKGMDTFRVVSEKQVLWLNLTGSGNETSAHVQENGRMTIMFCSFSKKPLILKLYGQAEVIHPRDNKWEGVSKVFDEHVGARQIFKLDLDLVLTSCGHGVPLFEYQGDRDLLLRWADKRGRRGVEEYWKEKNQISLDGKPTNILKDA